MRKCSNCNKLCPDTDKFCQTCGLPTKAVEETPGGDANGTPAKKKKTGLILGICGALAVIAALAAILLIPKRGKSDPMRRFFAAQDEFITNEELVKKGLTVDSLMSGEYKPEINNISTDAELSFDIKGLNLGGLDLGGMDLSSLDLSEKLSKLSLYFQIMTEGENALNGIQLRYSGSPIISATIDSTKDGFGFYIPELSEKRYELSREFFTGLMSGEGENAYADMDIDIKFDKVADLKSSYEALKKDYLAIFYKGFAVEDFVQTDGSINLDNLNKEVASASRITLTPNSERFCAMLKEMAERIKSDKALSDHLLSLMQHYLGEDGMKLMLSGLSESVDLANGESGLLPAFEKIAKKLGDEAENTAKRLAESKFTWSVVTKADDVFAQYLAWDKGNVTFEKLEADSYFDVKADGKSVINCVCDLKKTEGIETGKVTLTAGENSEFKADITVSELNREIKSAIGIPYGKYDIDFTATAENDTAVKLKLNIEVAKAENGGTDHRITLTGLDKMPGNDGAPESISICLHTTDKEASVTRPTAETVKIESQEQLESVGEELAGGLEGVISKLMLALLLG